MHVPRRDVRELESAQLMHYSIHPSVHLHSHGCIRRSLDLVHRRTKRSSVATASEGGWRAMAHFGRGTIVRVVMGSHTAR